MTVSSTTNRVSYTGNGVTTAFSTSFQFLLSADIDVYVAGILQTETTHYTVSGGSGASGTVTFLTAPAASAAIVLVRNPDATQTLDLVENDPLPAEELEKAFDKLTMLAQRQSDLTSRSVTLADSASSSASTQLPEAEAGKLLGWAGDGLSIVNTSASAVGAGSIGTTELADLSVTTAKLAAGAATLAKLDTTGDSGRVLVAAGSGVAPTWSAPPDSPTYLILKSQYFGGF